MIVCVCNNVSDKAINIALESGDMTLQDLKNSLKIGSCCGKCVTYTKSLIRKNKKSNSVSIINIQNALA
tara:strand:- start:216 stop:422 length:207 start_codon:yes stop_codon:yes gene_type:complete